ncbi:MAG: DEAD/DEAH box helicase [Chloroflexi bacterium]|nr:DEAD/DEAH box helicase [Chloroflexota bacterium]
MPEAKTTQGNSPEPVAGPMSGFLPVVADWFGKHVGIPTAPQVAAWPRIQRGENVLIHSPTGTGKTFAAFLWAINDLVARPPVARSGRSGRSARSGVRVLYVSPLKALNNDIERNLSVPLAGIAEAAGEMARAIRTAVRTGDTTPSARAAMVRNPPDILITTPESLYLILTSPKARDILRTVETVIIDEIHTVSDNKRGTHLALSLERLERLSPGFQRIGLSATQRPVEEVARFLGGQDVSSDGDSLKIVPRPVSIVDVDYEKEIIVNVFGMPEAASASPASSIWPNLIPRVLKDVLQHDTTLIFANSRRQAERTADRLNAQLQIEDAADLGKELGVDPDSFSGGLFGTGHGDGPFRAHHASISEEQRRQMERDLKRGDLPALIGTSSLELGIDIGSIDLVVQLQSPGSVTQGLQRIGDRMFRHVALEWVADWAKRSGRTLTIWGNGWERHPTLAKYAQGPVQNGQQLRALYQASAINLQLMGFGFIHQRALDGLMSGAFFMARRTYADRAGLDKRQLIRLVDQTGLSDADGWKELSDGTLKDQLEEVVARLQGDLRGLCPGWIDVHRRTSNSDYAAEIIPHFDEITFATQDDFEARAERFLGNPDLRATRAQAMRRVVTQRYSYTSRMSQMLQFLRDGMASEARIHVESKVIRMQVPAGG